MNESYLAMKVFLSSGLMLGAVASFLIIMRRAKLPHGGYLVRHRYLASVVLISLLASSLVFGQPKFLGAISLPSAGLAFLIVAIMGLRDHVSLRRRLDGARLEPILISGNRRLLIIAVGGLSFLVGFVVFSIIGWDFYSVIFPLLIGFAVVSLLEYCWVVSLERRLGEPLVERHLHDDILTMDDELTHN